MSQKKIFQALLLLNMYIAPTPIITFNPSSLIQGVMVESLQHVSITPSSCGAKPDTI